MYKIRDCYNCDLSLFRNRIVNGSGNIQSQIVFIGEAPGYHEDKHGLPFIGKSGKLLDYYLDLAGFKRDQVYITNMVKCRPPANRTPSVGELQRCKYYLREELITIKPRIIVCLGAVASSLLIPNFTKVSDHRLKSVVTRFGAVLLCTYHPSYILQNQLYDLYYKDFVFIAKAYKLLSNPFHEYKQL